MSEESTTAEATETDESTESTVSTTETTDWRDSLPDDLKADPSLASIKDVQGLAKGYVHAQKLVGADKVVIPGRDAPQEEIDAFYAKLGRPESADKYEWPTENLPEGVEIADADKGKIGEIAHDLGLSKTQAAKLYRAYAQQIADGQASISSTIEQQRTEAEQSLRKEWGKAFDQNIALAQSAVKEFGGDELLQALDGAGLSNHPAVVKAMAKIGRAISEDEVIGGGKKQSFDKSPAEAQAELANLGMDAEFTKALTQDNHPGHAAAVKRRQALYEQAYPEN